MRMAMGRGFEAGPGSFRKLFVSTMNYRKNGTTSGITCCVRFVCSGRDELIVHAHMYMYMYMCTVATIDYNMSCTCTVVRAYDQVHH